MAREVTVLESELAWYLADEYRDRVNAADRSLMFVHMGAGDFVDAIGCLLDALAREGIRLAVDEIAKLTDWLRVYDRDAAFHSAVARVTP